MRITVAHGLYQESGSFGEEVVQEYSRKHDPSGKFVVPLAIENSATREDSLAKGNAYTEIGRYLQESDSLAFIQIDTLGSPPISQREIRESVIGRKLGELGKYLSEDNFNPFGELQGMALQNELARFRKILTGPIRYSFFNSETNRSLDDYLANQSSFCNMTGNSKVAEHILASDLDLYNSVLAASQRGIPYLWLGAAVSETEHGIVDDDYKREALKRSVEFIHSVREAVSKDESQ